MKLIEHFVDGKIIPGSSDRKGKVFNPATGEQESEVRLASKSDLDQAVEVAKKAGCKKSELFSFGGKIPIQKIINCEKIGLTSGASAPEELVQGFISEIKKHTNVSIEEFVSIKENVTFKLPSVLN